MSDRAACPAGQGGGAPGERRLGEAVPDGPSRPPKKFQTTGQPATSNKLVGDFFRQLMPGGRRGRGEPLWPFGVAAPIGWFGAFSIVESKTKGYNECLAGYILPNPANVKS